MNDLDIPWFRMQLIEGTVSPRLGAPLAGNGFYRSNLNRQWQPVGDQVSTLITQTRIIYVFAVGYQVAGEERYLEAMKRCADFLLSHFADKAVPGRWAKSVAPDGTVIDGSFHAYAHTHVIFALAHAYQATQEKRYLEAALRTWVHLNVPGILAGRERGLAFNRLNFTMHCFESLLALQKAAASTMVRDDLRALGQHIVTYFPDPKRGFFYESLDKNFKPVSAGKIRLGHNAEMAFLLGRAADAGLPSKWLPTAQRLIDFVVAQGIAPDGSLPHKLDYSFRVKDSTLVWWSHTELLRSLAYFAWHRGRMELKPAFAKSLTYVKLHFIDPVHGGWYWNADRPDMPKGGDWNAGYHVAMMLTEILRLGRTRFVSGQEILL